MSNEPTTDPDTDDRDAPGPLATARISDLPGDTSGRNFVGTEHGNVPVSLIIIDNAPGEGPDLHQHDYAEVIVVLEGEMTVTDGHTSVTATAGDIAIAPARRPHAFRNTGTGPLRSIDIHTHPSYVTRWLDDPPLQPEPHLMDPLTATIELPIRATPDQVFDAFTQREWTCQFWLADASNDLQPGGRAEWTFHVPGAVETVDVELFERPNRLAFRWSDGIGVEVRADGRHDDTTAVRISVSGFPGDDPTGEVANAVQGFTTVLCDAKVLLETGSSPGLVRAKAVLVAESLPTE